MEIGIMKIGANITQSSSILTASNFDLFSLVPILSEAGHTVRIFTKITRNTKIMKPYKLHNYMEVESLNKLDALLVFNGPINFFGGTEEPGIIRQWELINSYEGPVYYVMTDCRYPFSQLWDLMTLKPWHTKYDREKIYVKRDDIQYLYQGVDSNKLIDLNRRRKKNVTIKQENIHYFPIDWAIMLDTPEPILTPTQERPYDLIYGGSNRDANRKNKLHEYYVDNNLDTLIFGSIKVNDSKNPVGAVPHKQFIKKLSTGKATVIIGDKFYQDNFFTLRMYESILAGCITFIDRDFDSFGNFYNEDEYLSKFLYVSSFNEVQEKLTYLENNPDECSVIQARQLQCIETMYDKKEYKNRLLNLIGG